MNTVRAALGEETHCVFGEYHNEPSVDQTVTQTGETLQLTIFIMTPFKITMRANAKLCNLNTR